MSNATPTAKRAPNFSETHEYIVSGLTAEPLRIYRDDSQFSYARWLLVRAWPEDDRFVGFTKAEALSRLAELFGAEVSS